jgi:hypothetical protein
MVFILVSFLLQIAVVFVVCEEKNGKLVIYVLMDDLNENGW